MNPASVDIKDKIIEVTPSLGLTFATNLFIGKEPSEPDNCVTIFDTPGYPPLASFDGLLQYDKPSVQIRVRNLSYLVGWTLIDHIKRVLHNRSFTMLNGTIYTNVLCSQEPALLDWDANNRARFVATFDVQRTI